MLNRYLENIITRRKNVERMRRREGRADEKEAEVRLSEPVPPGLCRTPAPACGWAGSLLD